MFAILNTVEVLIFATSGVGDEFVGTDSLKNLPSSFCFAAALASSLAAVQFGQSHSGASGSSSCSACMS